MTSPSEKPRPSGPSPRLFPFAKPVLGRLVLGAVSALVRACSPSPSRSCSRPCRARSRRGMSARSRGARGSSCCWGSSKRSWCGCGAGSSWRPRRGRVRHAHELLRAPAAPARRLPRPLAVGAAAQPHDAGHLDAAALARLRPRPARRQHADDPRRHGAAVPLALGARDHLPHRLRAALVRRLPLREDVRHARPASQDQAGDLATASRSRCTASVC
jgi:hypothetical protein